MLIAVHLCGQLAVNSMIDLKKQDHRRRARPTFTFMRAFRATCPGHIVQHHPHTVRGPEDHPCSLCCLHVCCQEDLLLLAPSSCTLHETAQVPRQAQFTQTNRTSREGQFDVLHAVLMVPLQLWGPVVLRPTFSHSPYPAPATASHCVQAQARPAVVGGGPGRLRAQASHLGRQFTEAF